jgi:ABC-type multidrug transport system fused ATPase/permease subunit
LSENASGSIVSRLATDPKQVQELIGLNGAFPLISTFSMIGCIAIAFSFGWKLSLVTVFAALPCTFLAAFMRIRYELQFESMNAAVYAGSSQFAAEAIDAFRTVSSLTMEDTILDRYTQLLREQQKKAFRKARYATLIFAFSDSVELCAMALTFWFVLLPDNYNRRLLMVTGMVGSSSPPGSTNRPHFSLYLWRSSRADNRQASFSVSHPTLLKPLHPRTGY